MLKSNFNCAKKNNFCKSENFYKEKEFERNYSKTHPEFRENFEKKSKYYRDCFDYLQNFELYLPPKNFNKVERFFLEKAVSILTPLAKPHKLADFLHTDVDYVYDALEDKIIPHFSYGSSYHIKTAEIIPFIRNSYENILKNRKIFYGKH